MTEAEKAEQQALRREYIDDMKASLRAPLANTSIQEPDGTIPVSYTHLVQCQLPRKGELFKEFSQSV